MTVFLRLATRLGFGAVLLVLLSLVGFGLFHALPGDAARQLLSQMMDGAPPDAAVTDDFRRSLGLDRPLHEQYLTWLGRLLQGELGRSLQTGNPVALELGIRARASLELMAASLLVLLALSLPLGLWAALRAGRLPDRVILSVSVLALSMPNFWLGLLLLLLFALVLGLLPVGGYGGAAHLVLPALVVGSSMAGLTVRYVRSWTIDALGADHVRTARAKGLSTPRVLLGHVLPGTLPALLTLLGLQAARMFDSLVVVETVFGWPGMGSYLAGAVLSRDLPSMQAALLAIGAAYIAMNLAVDLLAARLDPRAEGLL